MGDGGPGVGGSGRLPVPLTRFVGRETELPEVLELVRRARLVTVVGAPGGGKTRLALECSTRWAPRPGVQVWWVELAPIAPTMVASAVAAAGGVRAEPGQSTQDSLVAALAPAGDVLMVLDNCEHLVDPVADLVDRLLASCPGLRILTTSRSPLGLPGEQVWTVPELDPASARELFVDRAGSVSTSPGDGGEDDEVVDAICSGLDRLPLAIELAAAWTRTLSPAQILDRLAESPALLVGPGRGRPPRQATMEAAVDWSRRLLPADAQQLFERLAVFVDGFDLDAARAVAPPSVGDALGAVASLVDQSLVVAERSDSGQMRYRMLEPVRQCAEGRLLASGKNDAARRCQAEHYVRLASGVHKDVYADPAVMRMVTEEENNVLAALEWARGQSSDLGLRLCDVMVAFWSFRGRVEQGRALLAERLAAGTPDHRLRANALVWAAHFAWRTGDIAGAREILDDASVFARQVGDTWAEAAVLATQGIVLGADGDAAAAIVACQESLELSRSIGEEIVWARHHLVWAYYLAGDIAAGDEEARAILADHGDSPLLAGAALFALQYGACLRGDAGTQRRYLTEALKTMEQGGMPERPDWLGCAAALAATEGRRRAALRVLGGADALARFRGARPPAAVAAPIVALFFKVWNEVGRPLADRLFEQGASMTWDELVATALAGPGDPSCGLTSRELQVAQLVAEGLANAEIAQELYVSRRTVESHLDHVRQKLGFSSRHQIIAWVLRDSPG